MGMHANLPDGVQAYCVDYKCIFLKCTVKCSYFSQHGYTPVINLVIICNGKVKVWSFRGETYYPDCIKTPPITMITNRTNMMLWGCIGIHGVRDLVLVPGRINSEVYTGILHDNLPQSVEHIFGDRNTLSCVPTRQRTSACLQSHCSMDRTK
jgi:hypothetical protein